MHFYILKLWLLGAVLVAGLAGASSPWALRGVTGKKGRALALGDTFTAGVLGGAGLLHLLDGGIETLRYLAPGLHYPLAQLTAGAAFLLILLIESVVIGSRHRIVGAAKNHRGFAHELPADMFAETGHTHAFILLVVLSVHSIILGLALGAQETRARMLIVFIAIMSHKVFAGFALGTGYRRVGYPLSRAIGAIAFFSCMTPLGILLGTFGGGLLSGKGERWFEAIADSAGAGTFLYIASLDILRSEFDENGGTDLGWKWLLTLAGYAVMAVLALWN